MPDNSWNDIGSGNPYSGSGFANFDRFMQPENIQWGASQPQEGYEYPGTDWSLQTPYDEWMINLGNNAKTDEPTETTAPPSAEPTQAPPANVAHPPVDSPVDPLPTGRDRLPERKQDDLARYDPSNPENQNVGFPRFNAYMNQGVW
jgi:hypothetical protein